MRISNWLFNVVELSSPLCFTSASTSLAIDGWDTARLYAIVLRTVNGSPFPLRKKRWHPRPPSCLHVSATVVAIVLVPVPAPPVNRSTFGCSVSAIHPYILWSVCSRVFSKHSGRPDPQMWDGLRAFLSPVWKYISVYFYIFQIVVCLTCDESVVCAILFKTWVVVECRVPWENTLL